MQYFPLLWARVIPQFYVAPSCAGFFPSVPCDTKDEMDKFARALYTFIYECGAANADYFALGSSNS